MIDRINRGACFVDRGEPSVMALIVESFNDVSGEVPSVQEFEAQPRENWSPWFAHWRHSGEDLGVSE